MRKESENKFKIIDFLILFCILIIAFAFRLYKINTPLADFNSWQQTNTAAVARNFVNNGFDLLHPRFDDLSPNGYKMVEFPIYNAIFAFSYKYLPITSLEIYGRLTTIFFSLIIIGIIYFLLLKEINRFSAVIGSLTYSVFPFFVFFSRVILPETTALGLAFLSLFFLYLFSVGKNKSLNMISLLASAVLFSLGLLTKPTVIFYLIPAAYLFYKKYGFDFYKKIPVYIYVFLAIAPLLMWRYYIGFYPNLQSIFFKPVFLINNTILGEYLSILFILGILSKNKNHLLSSILISSLLYLFVFQGNNIQHEYYQILILPSLAIFVALGTNFIYKNYKLFIFPPITAAIILLIFLFSFLVSYSKVKNYYNYSNDLVSIANVIKDFSSKDDKIVTDTEGDTTLLYLADRRGAPVVFKDLNKLKKDGYAYFITSKQDFSSSLKSKGEFILMFENEKFAIFKL